MSEHMTGTDLANALAIPKNTPGCWGYRCTHLHCPCDSNHCFRCGAAADLVCLWPLPDSGLPGAELWTYWLMRALGWPKVCEHLGKFKLYMDTKGEWMPTPVAALYAAWKEMKNG